MLDEFDDVKRRLTQLENVARSLLDALEGVHLSEMPENVARAYEAIAAVEALLDGEGAPADTEEPDA